MKKYSQSSLNFKQNYRMSDDDVSHIGCTLPPGQIFLLDTNDVISEEECDFVVSNIKIHKIDNIESIGKHTNVQCHGTTLENIAIKDQDASAKIRDILQKAFDKLAHKIKNLIDIGGTTQLQLREIYGATNPHYDCPTNKEDDRMMSVIIALNDDYKGGIVHLPEQNFSCKLKKLQMIAFPPFWTHPHYVTKPLDGTVRYTVNTWLNFSRCPSISNKVTVL